MLLKKCGKIGTEFVCEVEVVVSCAKQIGKLERN
jgi:hypothetical protein